jgi:uncharacterized cupredoxin-like copper-binding protein
MKRMSIAAVLAALALSAIAVGVFAGAGTASPRSATATTVAVAASEFKFVLSKKVVPKGTVTFVVKNKGKTAHDFKILGKKTKTIAPGKSATLRVTLKKGRYPYLCTLPGHAAAGMKGTLTATG